MGNKNDSIDFSPEITTQTLEEYLKIIKAEVKLTDLFKFLVKEFPTVPIDNVKAIIRQSCLSRKLTITTDKTSRTIYVRLPTQNSQSDNPSLSPIVIDQYISALLIALLQTFIEKNKMQPLTLDSAQTAIYDFLVKFYYWNDLTESVFSSSREYFEKMFNNALNYGLATGQIFVIYRHVYHPRTPPAKLQILNSQCDECSEQIELERFALGFICCTQCDRIFHVKCLKDFNEKLQLFKCVNRGWKCKHCETCQICQNSLYLKERSKSHRYRSIKSCPVCLVKFHSFCLMEKFEKVNLSCQDEDQLDRSANESFYLKKDSYTDEEECICSQCLQPEDSICQSDQFHSPQDNNTIDEEENLILIPRNEAQLKTDKISDQIQPSSVKLEPKVEENPILKKRIFGGYKRHGRRKSLKSVKSNNASAQQTTTSSSSSSSTSQHSVPEQDAFYRVLKNPEAFPGVTLDDMCMYKRAMVESQSKNPNITTSVDSVEDLISSNIRCPPFIRFGKFLIETWYSSPFPVEYARCSRLYICEYCLKYMRSKMVMIRHREKCMLNCPPGDEIYRSSDFKLSVFEVDGFNCRSYCQSLCLISKLFLDHKTLYYDVEPFLFYVLTINDQDGSHIIGYFSKEKVSAQKYNVSCIMTLPQYQRMGYGRFLIDFSYLLSRTENEPGSPEKPLSLLGLKLYSSYWESIVIEYMLKHWHLGTLKISDMVHDTGIDLHDLSSTLNRLNLFAIKDDGSVYLRFDMENLCEKIEKCKSIKKICLEPYNLHWVPPSHRCP